MNAAAIDRWRTPRDRAQRDAAIRRLITDGASATQIERALRVSREAIRLRAHAFGIAAQLTENGRREALRSIRHRGSTLSVGKWVTAPRRVDAGPSDIVRRLRRHTPSGTACIDADHIVACLHARGVTLIEIEDHLGIPQLAAVAAIQKFAGLSV